MVLIKLAYDDNDIVSTEIREDIFGFVTFIDNHNNHIYVSSHFIF